MSLIEIEFMKTNEKFIKYEEDYKPEFDDDENIIYDPPTAGQYDEDSDSDLDTAKCGEILVSNNGKFVFICVFCDEPFREMTKFGEHMHRDHLKLENNDCDQDFSNISTQSPSQSPKLGLRRSISPDLKSPDRNQWKFDSKTTLEQDDYSDLYDKNEDDEEDRVNPNYLEHFRNFLDHAFYSDGSEQNENMESSFKEMENKNDIISEPKKPSPTVSTNKDEKLRCDVCDRQYITEKGFKRHRERHEVTGPPLDSEEEQLGITKESTDAKSKKLSPLKCRYCEKQFQDKTKRIHHERAHTGEKPFQCPHCPKCFRTSRLRSCHILIHTGERPYKCTYCPVAFTHRMNLTVHIRAHLGEKRFECDFCGKRFVRNVDRRIHMRSHTKEKPYQCEQCGASFSTSSKLTEHKKRHTNTKDFKCDLCGKAFYSKYLLKNHQVVHSNERPFQCEICMVRFPRKRALQSHVKIHSNVKEYVCTICSKAFAQNAGLYCHMKTHGLKIGQKLEIIKEEDDDLY